MNVLFLCTGNSARSILAEAILNQKAPRRFRAYSAGSHPAGSVSAGALKLLGERGIPTTGLRSKSWDEFARPDAPRFDFVITVCDNAAGELCPIWPGRPVTAHWGVPDPAAISDPIARSRAFDEAFQLLSKRIDLLISLPMTTRDNSTMAKALREIGMAGP